MSSSINLFEIQPEKYYSPPSSFSKDKLEMKIQQMIDSNQYIYSLKTDGNYLRFVCHDGIAKMQTRGISKKTGTYDDVQKKIFFFDSIKNAFSDDTFILGECYVEGGRDKDVGSILRCLTDKALARQAEQKLRYRIFDVWFLNGKNLMNTPMKERIKYLAAIVSKINNPLVDCVKYYPMDEHFYGHLMKILDGGGEGVVCTHIDKIPLPGERKSWMTLKVKQEIQDNIDCFISGVKLPVRQYGGDHLEEWEYWEDNRTGEKLQGIYIDEYKDGSMTIDPVTKNYFYGWPAAIECSVLDRNGNDVKLCNVSGITEQFKEELKNDYSVYDRMPISITGMMISKDNSGDFSIRHPKFVALRQNDLNISDCLLSKLVDKED